MDYACKFGKQNKTLWSKPRLCPTTKPCSTRPAFEPLEEDRRLKNWNRWLLDREKRQKYLFKVLGRKPEDLILNAHEKVRSRNEKRCLLQAAIRPEVTNQDKYRGNPFFWKPVDRLINNRDDEKEDDVIGFEDRDGRNLPPELTRVALPDFIKKEKMLVESLSDAGKINLITKWECGDYLRQRTLELHSELQVLDEKEPEMEKLIITGRKFQCGNQKQSFIRVPVITITPSEIKYHLLHDPDDRIALKIQDQEFVFEKGRHFERLSLEQSRRLQETNEDKNDKAYAYSLYEFDRVYKILPKIVTSITWSLTFYSNGNEKCTKTFVLENRGVFVVKLHWRKESVPCLPFRIPDRLDSPFFFNKNHLTILPGQQIEIPLWFCSEYPTLRTEIWKLSLEPKIYPGNLYLRLWGISEGKTWKDNQRQEYENIKAILSIRMRNSIIREVVDDIVHTATYHEHHLDNVPYNRFFLEYDVFQVRNPTYFYRSMLVDELKEMFKEITSCNVEQWNLSLANLRSNLLIIHDPNVRREKFERFQEICFESLRPTNFYTRTYCTKKNLVRWLLCGFFNRFKDESDFIVNTICSDTFSNYYEDEESGSDVCLASENIFIYREMLYVRIYHLLGETVDGICAMIDSYNFLNKNKD